jgi:hypothetical protein
MKVEAAECSSCFAELSPAIPTSDEPICSPTDALDTGLDASLPVDGPSMDLFDGLPDLDNTLPFTGTPSGGSISLHVKPILFCKMAWPRACVVEVKRS